MIIIQYLDSKFKFGQYHRFKSRSSVHPRRKRRPQCVHKIEFLNWIISSPVFMTMVQSALRQDQELTWSQAGIKWTRLSLAITSQMRSCSVHSGNRTHRPFLCPCCRLDYYDHHNVFFFVRGSKSWFTHAVHNDPPTDSNNVITYSKYFCPSLS